MNNFPQVTVSAGKLLRELETWVLRPEFQYGFGLWPDGSPKSYCNIFVFKFGNAHGYDMRSFCRDRNLKLWGISPIDLVYKQLMEDLQEVKAREAQSLANIGKFVVVWSVNQWHAAVVCADTEQYNKKLGPLTVQAGRFNGKMYVSSGRAFGREWFNPEIKYFVVEKVKEDGK